MTAWVRESRNARSIALLLFALVLAIRVAIPTGFMPTVAPSGIVISVCTGMGQTKVFLPIEKEGDRDRHGPAESPCTFVTTPGDGLTTADVLTPTVQPFARTAAPASRAIADLTINRLAAPPPPAIGPPARA